MERQTLVAAWGMAVAALVVAVWAVNLAAGRVSELQTKPWEIRLHIAAEAMMAATLALGAILVLAGAAPGPGVLGIGLGMTLYAIVNAGGYYVERGERTPSVVFAVLFVITLLAAIALVA